MASASLGSTASLRHERSSVPALRAWGISHRFTNDLAQTLGSGRVVRPFRRPSRGTLVSRGRFRPLFAAAAFGEPVLGERVAGDDARQYAQAFDPDTLLFVAQRSLGLHIGLPRARLRHRAGARGTQGCPADSSVRAG